MSLILLTFVFLELLYRQIPHQLVS